VVEVTRSLIKILTEILLQTKKQSNLKDKFMLNIEGTLIKNPQILADTFNDYFSKVVDKSISNITK
jgi:hypothetical protein